MKHKQFIYQKKSGTIRLMPGNYMVMCWSVDKNRWVFDFDHAVQTDILAQVIDVRKTYLGTDGEKFVELLNKEVCFNKRTFSCTDVEDILKEACDNRCKKLEDNQFMDAVDSDVAAIKGFTDYTCLVFRKETKQW